MKKDAKQVDHVSGKSAQQFAAAQKNFPPPEANPHIRGDNTTRNIMMWMVIALMPSVLGAGYLFGFRVWGLYAIAIATAQLCEVLWFKLNKRELTWDLSAVVTAILLTANMPPSAPWYFPIIGSAFAIIVVKEFFGGIGFNFINPALGGRALLVGLFFTEMFKISWPNPPFDRIVPDAVTSATPLAVLNSGGNLSGQELFNTFVGNIGGRLGETSTLLILIGGGILLWKKIIHIRIPLTMLGTIAVIAFVFDGQNFFTADLTTVLGYVFGGGAVFGAFFMATDYASTPSTRAGEYIFAFCCGLLVMLFRYYGVTEEGVSYSILIMNCLTPLIDYVLRNRVIGEEGNQLLNIKWNK
ncbi:electron transport complex subunit D [Enterococcus florum]|uniref:Ion-translocating oxidoreductase complex subunit D n=1 Tax=Enterococcus florum TaxID=2480627 RepID=A0A4P5P9Q9_9ENTE|nr:RnfABCDGE type electron transport complex subunit D [Enterococcus florum]GCF94326.1 electron transport complex subunit D [Enterococcus florum]